MQNPFFSSYNSDILLARDARPGNRLKALTLLTIAGFSLVLTRGLITGNWWFLVVLTWNLFLAWFPLGVVMVLQDLRQSGFRSKWLLVSGLMLWLVFLPNAPYIITDLYHLKEIPHPLLWFDTMALFLFALTGLLIGLYSILIVHRMLRPLVGEVQTWFLILSSQLLSGFGIYLGRFGRWNSWDVLTRPSALGRAIIRAYEDHLSLKLTLGYGFVLIVLYVAFYWYVQHENEATHA
ncbi:DUF1361 domain-containing protein [Spirosoma sp.]|uniref:DUF1361 domain-containing protein n=1 Tax=Spirosoma sp. TaxID=1899569 RepID=UPI003B3B1EEA